MAVRSFEADVVVIGLGAAGSCAAIEAHDAGASVIALEKQPRDRHYSNTRMSGGGYHSPEPGGDFAALKSYAKAMFSGDDLPNKIEGEQTKFADEIAELWAKLSPENEAFMRGLDPDYRTVKLASAAFPHFPGAAQSGYAVVKSTYSGTEDEAKQFEVTLNADKSQKESGEAFHACLMTGLQARGIDIRYGTRAAEFVMESGEVTGVLAECDGETVLYRARRGVVLTSGGYEYNAHMRKAFLDGPGIEGWAFYGSSENTGDGIRMAMKIGAGLSRVGSVAGRVICAVPERRHGLKVGLNTSSVGKPNEIVVDSYGARYASERRITKDPSRYIFYKEALLFDTLTMSYPRIPSWMIFDQKLMSAGPLVRLNSAAYNGIDWGADNQKAVSKGWVLKADTLEELAAQIGTHPDDHGRMDAATLAETVTRWNEYCAAGQDAAFARETSSMGPVDKPPYYAMPLYPGGPNTKGGVRANAQREVLDWDDVPIPRLYSAGEISSVFLFAYQGGGNLAEGITFGRLAGRNAACPPPRASKDLQDV